MIGARADHADESVFPEAVEAAGHQVVHDVVFGCYGIEYAVDFFGLFLGGYGLFTELCLFRVLHTVISNLTMLCRNI